MNVPMRAYGVLKGLLLRLPYFRFIRETARTQTPISFETWFCQRVLGVNRGPYWPVHPSSKVVGWQNILLGVETSPGLMPSCYIQGIGKIMIGDYTQVAAGVAIISANHALEDNRGHVAEQVAIGRYCWIGFGAIILPGVTLVDYTVVGAGCVVTKSFPEGYTVIVGNPARYLKGIDPGKCVFHVSEHEYHGYIPKARFAEFRRRHLRV
jgi:carbonic anhydrase/acetyltransferase-like protein (isoleucine patch superfamily)